MRHGSPKARRPDAGHLRSGGAGAGGGRAARRGSPPDDVPAAGATAPDRDRPPGAPPAAAFRLPRLGGAARAVRRPSCSPWEPVLGRGPSDAARPSPTASTGRRARSQGQGTALPLFLHLRDRGTGRWSARITLDNMRRGPAQAGTMGYWVGQLTMRGRATWARRSRRWCITRSTGDGPQPDREPPACRRTRPPARLLERSGFKYEGVAQAYLQIAGRWRNHVLYAMLRGDRRGRTEAG